MSTTNQLHLWDDRFFYITEAIQSGLTARASATLLASASGRPFVLVALDGTVLRCTAALVAPHVPRQLDADGCGLLSLNVDPASGTFRRLAARLDGRGILPLDAAGFGALREDFEGALHGELDSPALRRLSGGMLDAACGSAVKRPRGADRPCLDPRVERVLQRMRDAGSHGMAVPLCDLAAVACLSPGRLTHLFHEQTGLSIKRYLLWSKIRRTVQMMASGMPLTGIALAGGFTDGAHMSRTFQRCFGLTPSFLADAGRVDVFVDDCAHTAWRGTQGG
ncbi:AraC family transcriptional regulator [Paracidovorax avenae]|uniref:helix-turn-helix domain-containing protein n=1 Tax=Paracidovorax TaxID=3051137 RepID=UPI0002E05655|nr:MULTISPECIES: helix-turn-helix domain-containing protein [Paracidovorax]AVS91944.1 AraC family transcriptional regulator [Paracidovorax avenae]AVS98286.1 AraC family transcriptional regulator [Paracidovorax avenae]AVT05290.1 AraC family transcriptional regulator [Paracidovorax avenae]AVT19501.1 AraC family transcriptional regulator [Paracidovorax avenae]